MQFFCFVENKAGKLRHTFFTNFTKRIHIHFLSWYQKDERRKIHVREFPAGRKKYLMSKEIYREFLKETEKYIRLDEFGLHTICNIYFDTDHYDLDDIILKEEEKQKKMIDSIRCRNGNLTVICARPQEGMEEL